MTNTILLALLKKLEGKVDSLETISFESVTELPETGEPNIIYLVPKSDPETGNYSDEYIWDSDNQTYEKIGDTQVSDLPEVTSADNGKILEVINGVWGISIFDKITFFKAGYNSGPPEKMILKDSKTISDIKNAVKNNEIPIIIDENSIYSLNRYLYPIYTKYSNSNSDPVQFVQFSLFGDSLEIAIYSEGNKSYGYLTKTKHYFTYNLPSPMYQTNKVLGVSNNTYSLIDPTPNANPNIAPSYDATATYDLGDLCIYNGNLYECITAISTAEEWTAAHWTQKTVAQELAGVGGSDIEIFEGTISGKKINLSNNKKVEDIFNAINGGKRVILNAGNLIFYNIYNVNNYALGFVSLNAQAPDSNSYNLFIYYAECYSSYLQRTYINLISSNNTVGYSTIQKLFLQSSNGNYSYYSYSTDENGVAILVKDRSRLIANMYTNNTTYNSGDLAINRTSLELYRCNTDNTTGAWDSTKWDQVTVEDLLNAIPALPTVTSSDKGKVLEVNSSGQWAAATPSKELPTVTSSDEGKVLTVDSNGNWVAGNIPDGSNTSY